MRKELGVFLVVGTLTVAVDYTVYRLIAWSLPVDVHGAKGVGFLAGTLFSYLANRSWTFGGARHARGSAWRFALLYGATLLINVGANALALGLLGGMRGAIALAFLVATGLSATLNFAGMKYYVFRHV